jgi:hypothetical protein
MKCLTIWILIIALTGCTTLRPLPRNQADLPLRLAPGDLLKPGDHVVIATNDLNRHEFVVSALSVDMIYGKHESIAIDSITGLQKRVLDGHKTVLLVGLITLGIALVVALTIGLEGAAAAAALGAP